MTSRRLVLAVAICWGLLGAAAIAAVTWGGTSQVVRTVTAAHAPVRAIHKRRRRAVTTAPPAPAETQAPSPTTTPAGRCGLGRCPETVPNQPANATQTPCRAGYEWRAETREEEAAASGYSATNRQTGAKPVEECYPTKATERYERSGAGWRSRGEE